MTVINEQTIIEEGFNMVPIGKCYQHLQSSNQLTKETKDNLEKRVPYWQPPRSKCQNRLSLSGQI